MDFRIVVDKSIKVPIYQQIVVAVESAIDQKILGLGEVLPSINQVARENGLARETVVKGFSNLQEKGLINAVHGKGYYVSSVQARIRKRIFLLFDTFSAYKQTFYKGFKESLDPDCAVDFYFHHFNQGLFARLIDDALGNYTHYVILPFDAPEIATCLAKISPDKLYLTDRYPGYLPKGYAGVYQRFDIDIYQALTSILSKVAKYKRVYLVFCDTVTVVPRELKEGFLNFCRDNSVEGIVLDRICNDLVVHGGDAFLVIDDDDLVRLVDRAHDLNLKIGQEIGIISYNDTPLKKVVRNGISVISTDFRLMGETTARMILNNEHHGVANPCRFIDRGSF